MKLFIDGTLGGHTASLGLAFVRGAILIAFSLSLVVAMLAFAFGPPTFESHPGNGATLKGTTQVVTSYGISAFRQQMFEYGVRYKGDTLTDRCYVETIEDGKPVGGIQEVTVARVLHDRGLGGATVVVGRDARHGSEAFATAAAEAFAPRAVRNAPNLVLAEAGTSIEDGNGASEGRSKAVPSGRIPAARRKPKRPCVARSRSISSAEKPQG